MNNKLKAAMAGALLMLATGGAYADAQHPKIGFSIDDLRVERWTRDRDFFTAEAEKLGAKVYVQSADASEQRQISQIENLISRYEGVSEVAVIGIKDDKWGERPVALVVLKEGAAVTEDDIKQHVLSFSTSGKISKYAVPQIVKFIDGLAKTSVGKINKKWLREQFA